MIWNAQYWGGKGVCLATTTIRQIRRIDIAIPKEMIRILLWFIRLKAGSTRLWDAFFGCVSIKGDLSYYLLFNSLLSSQWNEGEKTGVENPTPVSS